jgi:hypothetical protein
MVLVLAGLAVGFTMRGSLASAFNAEVARSVAEIVLAVLLFVDATDVRGGFFGRDSRSAARVLFIALPLSVVVALLFGRWLLPDPSWAVLTVIACTVVPIDFASAPSILRDGHIPEKTLVVGIVVGGALALLTNAAARRDLMTEQSKRLLIVVAPILSYGLSVGIGGNGFVSAFVCGIALNSLRRSDTFREQLASADDIGFLLAATMWFVFGCATRSGTRARYVVACVGVRVVRAHRRSSGSGHGNYLRFPLAVSRPAVAELLGSPRNTLDCVRAVGVQRPGVRRRRHDVGGGGAGGVGQHRDSRHFSPCCRTFLSAAGKARGTCRIAPEWTLICAEEPVSCGRAATARSRSTPAVGDDWRRLSVRLASLPLAQ